MVKSDLKPDPESKPPPLLDKYSRRWLGYGIEFGGVIGLFTWAGYRADDYFGTMPWLTITGMLFAFIGMIYLLYKEISSDPNYKSGSSRGSNNNQE